jgi:hypothetical protein
MANAGSSPAELQKAIDAGIKPQSRPLPDTSVTFHLRNLFSHPGTTYNVGCLLEGSDPALVHETLIIGGHHDQDGMSRADTWHGADDNGSGTVAVVDGARVCRESQEAKTVGSFCGVRR